MMAFFDHAVDASGHSAHPLSLIDAFAGAHGRYATLQTEFRVKQAAILCALSAGDIIAAPGPLGPAPPLLRARG